MMMVMVRSGGPAEVGREPGGGGDRLSGVITTVQAPVTESWIYEGLHGKRRIKTLPFFFFDLLLKHVSIMNFAISLDYDWPDLGTSQVFNKILSGACEPNIL